MRSVGAQLPPVVLELGGHPLRWRLLRELAHSDRRVRELMASVQEPQSLVSYHLRRLRTAGIVSVRRSSFDGRDAYYSLDVERCGALLADAGAALHPALELATRPGSAPIVLSKRPCVLFLCTGNSARSQIAEALLRAISGDAVEAFSAGSKPKALHPNAVRVLKARGIDVSNLQPKHLDTFRRRRFDYVVTLCDRVREVCPEFPDSLPAIHWSIADPAAQPGSAAETYPAFERTATELETRIRALLHRITDEQEATKS